MNSQNTMLNQVMSVQVISKRENLGKNAELFTIRFVDEKSANIESLHPDREDSIVRCGTGNKLGDIGECGPDLFFELWDFSDSPIGFELT